jgi:hypothetical protein
MADGFDELPEDPALFEGTTGQTGYLTLTSTLAGPDSHIM